MFFDPLPAFGRSVDRGGAAKPSAMEILQYRPTDFHALENADDQTRSPFFGQNLILTLTGCYRLGNIDAIQLRLQETDALRSVGIGMARPNVISTAFAYAKFFSRSHGALIQPYDAIDT